MTVRGLLPSLGAGGSLIAAAVCAFAVFGGVLAFRGENPPAAQANGGDVAVPSRTVSAQTSAPSLVDTVTALAQTGQQAAARSAPAPRHAERRAAVRRRGTTPPATIAPRSGSTPAAPVDNGRGGSPTPKPAPAAPATPQAPEVPSGTVKRTVEQTRGAVEPVVDAVPAPARAPVEQVADTVEDVAGTVDETVDGLTGGLLK